MSTTRTERQESEIAVGGRIRLRALRATAASVLVATLLAGCAPLLGGSKRPTTIYAPAAHVQPSAQWPSVRWHLTVGRAFGARNAESLRIAVRPTPNELQVYKGAQWARPPGDMLEDTVLHALEDSGRIAVVARQGTGIGSDYRLLMDVRRFESDYAGGDVPTATIEVTAKLLHMGDQQLAGSHTFLQTRAARSTSVPDVVDAFEHALVAIGGDLAGWTLATGETYERQRR